MTRPAPPALAAVGVGLDQAGSAKPQFQTLQRRGDSIEALPPVADEIVAWAQRQVQAKRLPQPRILARMNKALLQLGLDNRISKSAFSRWADKGLEDGFAPRGQTPAAGARRGSRADRVLAVDAPATSESGGYRLNGGNVTAFTASAAAVLVLAYPATRALDLLPAKRDLARLNLRALARPRLQTIGVAALVPGTTQTTDATFNYTITVNARSLLIGARARATGPGFWRIRVQRTSDSINHTRQGADLILPLAAGDNEFVAADQGGDFEPVLVEPGDEIGWYVHGTTIEVVPDTARPLAGFDFEALETANVNPVPALPGELLSAADRVQLKAGEGLLIEGEGQSLIGGARGTDYLPASRYPGSVFMFGQGVRAARAGSFAGFAQGDGTATMVAAAESTMLNEDVSGAWGNTGLVTMADGLIEIAAVDTGLAPDQQFIFVSTAFKGGAAIRTIDHNSVWRRVLVDHLEGVRDLAAAAGKTVAAVVVPFREGHQDAIENTLTPEQWKAAIADYCTGTRLLVQSVLGIAQQVHFVVRQPSAYLTGTAGLGARDGMVAQALNDLGDEMSNFHVLGGDYWCSGYLVDDVHLDSYGYDMAAWADRLAIHEIVRLGRSPRRIKFLGGWWSGTSAAWRVWSADPLVFDTVNMTAVVNNGLALKVDGAIAPLAGLPTLDNAPAGARHPAIRQINFTLADPPAPGAAVQARCALDYVGGTVYRRDEGAVSNLCTGYDEQVTFNGSLRHIRHFAPHCKRDLIALAAAP